jgi:soluble lytic murein transglycosylase-like protein
VEAAVRLLYALEDVRTRGSGRIPHGEPIPRRRARSPIRAELEAFDDAIEAKFEADATNHREAGELMGRTRVVTLIVLAAMLMSGTRAERTAPPVSAASPVVATSSPTGFDEAQLVRFLERENTALSPNEIRRIAAAVIRYSARYELDPVLVTQVLWVESRARPWVRSPRGAIGLMQVMPHMAAELDLAGSLAAIETNIEAGCWILADNIRRLGEEDGISAYFWGSNIRGVSYLNRVKEARAAVRGASES